MLARASVLIILIAVAANAQASKAKQSSTAADRPATRMAQGYFKEYALDHIASGPAITVVDEDDNVWVALAKTGKLARLSNGVIDVFDIGPESRPVGLAAGTRSNGHAGAVWIAASYDNKLIRFDIQTRQAREFKIEGVDSWPFNVAIAPDGSIWFTERAAGLVGKLDPATGKVQHFEMPTQKGGPAGLAIDSKTGRVWLTESYADRIACLEPRSGQVREYKMGDTSTGLVSGPAGLALDAQGGVWFAKLEGKLGHISPGSEHIEIIDVPREARRVAGVTVAANGDVWAVALDGNLLLQYRPAGREFTLYPLPVGESDERPNVPPFAKTSRPFGIAVDRQGNVWFSQQYTGQLGVLDVAAPGVSVLSPSGTVRTAAIPLTVKALDRVAGVERISYKLDGKPVALKYGRLDLASVLPGKHQLEVVAVDGAGQSSTASVSINYSPDQPALLDLLERLKPRNKSGEAAKASLINAAQQVLKGDVRANLDQISKMVFNNAGLFQPFSSKALKAIIAYQIENAGRIVEVRLLDAPPFFSQTEILVHKGDTVLWKYDPPSDGHSISHNLHQIEIEGIQTRSGKLRAGESFSYRFNETGQFLIKNTERQGSSAMVRVIAQ